MGRRALLRAFPWAQGAVEDKGLAALVGAGLAGTLLPTCSRPGSTMDSVEFLRDDLIELWISQ